MSNEINDPQVGYVIEIPNSKTIIINVGSDDGYSIGDQFKVYEEGPEIIDSKTEEVLGRKDYIKETVTITEIYPSFSECQRLVTKERSAFGTVSAMVQGSTYKTATDLKVNEDQKKNWEIKNSQIEINDPIKIA